MQKNPAGYKCVFVIIELFNTLVNDFIAKKSACCNRVLAVTELVSGTKCSPMLKCSHTTSTRLRKVICFVSVYL